MNKDVWHKIMKEYIKSYESIVYLIDKGIMNEDDAPMLFKKLLENIIITFESEVKE